MKLRSMIIVGALISISAALGAGITKGVLADNEEVDTSALIAINDTNFPDGWFRFCVSFQDTDKDGYLSQAEINATKVLWCNQAEGTASNCIGVEYFTELEEFNCNGNDITDLDLSKNIKLKNLDCSFNYELKSLNLSKNTELEKLDCRLCSIPTLDVSNCHNLKELDVIFCQLSSLNASGTSLSSFNVFDSNTVIEELFLNNCPLLTSVGIDGIDVARLEIHGCNQIKEIKCNLCGIDYLDASFNPSLESIEANNNALSYLNTEGDVKLRNLYVKSGKLKSLDLSTNVNLVFLECGINNLESLDLSKNVELQHLNCLANELTELDVSKLTKLSYLNCTQNNLTDLDVSHCKELRYLLCFTNKITSLNIDGLTKLREVICLENSLSSLDVSGNTELYWLNCSQNNLTYLNISGCENLDKLIAHCNNLPSLNIYSNPVIQYLFLHCDKEDMGSYYSIEEPAENDYHYFSYDKSTKVYYQTTPTPTKIPTKAPTKTPTKKPTPVPVPSKGTIADFVERLYTVALGRPSEKDGKAYWVKEITNGNKTGADCGLFFLTSEEFNNRGLSIENYVETLYKTFFGRKSEPNGKAYWVGELKSGRKSRADVIWGFIDSKEWCNICAGYGVKSGAPTAKADIASQNAIDFATRLYTCCLGRAPEKGGLNYWSLALTNLEKTGSEAAQLFFESQEFVNLGLDNKEYITRLYTTFMDRQPEDGGMQYWLGEMTKGKTRRDVMASFAQSPEFTDICKKYGIDRGEVNMKAPQPPKPSADLKSECEKLVSRIKKTGKDYGWSTTTKVIRNTDSQYGIVITCTLNANRNIVLSVAAKAELKSDGTVDSFYASQSLDGGDGYDSYTERVSYDSLKSVLEYYSSNPG